MPVKHHNGDLLLSNSNVIAHGCNCFHTMGSGIARQIRAKYPRAYTADVKGFPKGDKNKLGKFTLIWAGETTVYNLYTQYGYGTGKDLDYVALVDCFRNLKKDIDSYDPNHELTVGIPRIGCGLAGGNWEVVEQIIESIFPHRVINVWTY